MKRWKDILLVLVLLLGVVGGACGGGSYSPTAPVEPQDDPVGGGPLIVGNTCPDDLADETEIPRCAEKEE